MKRRQISRKNVTLGAFGMALILSACSLVPTDPNNPTNPTVPPVNPGPTNPAATKITLLRPENFSSGSASVTLPQVGVGESVAVIPVHASQQGEAAMDYRIAAQGLSARSFEASQGLARSSVQRARQAALKENPELRYLAQQTRRVNLGLKRGVRPLDQTLGAQALGSNCPTPYSVGSTSCDFYVQQDLRSSTAPQVLVNATLLFETASAYFFVDDSYASQFTQEDFIRLGKDLEDGVMPVVNRYFGKIRDVDNNGKITIVLSNLNAYGYVNPYDLFADGSISGTGRSNEGDIFYATVPEFSPSGNTEAYFTIDMPSTLVHELKHLAATSVRTENPNGQLEDVWFEEASAVAAEELSPYGSKLTQYAQGQAAESLKNPQAFRIVDDDPNSGPERSSYYGYNFLHLWRLAERVGHDTFWKSWTAGPEIGIANIEKNMPPNLGAFADSMLDFSMALLFDHTGLVKGFDYQKINLRDSTWAKIGYQPLGTQVSGSTRSVAYYVGKGTGSDVTLNLSSSSTAPYAIVVRYTGQLPY